MSKTSATQSQNERVICRFISAPPDAMYDLGVGPKTEYRTLGRLYPKMKIFGCEPSPVMYDRLLAAKFPGVLAKVAIGENEGTATLHYDPDDLKVASLYRGGPLHTTVRIWSLDRFDAQMGAPDRILLWADIEGAELSAFRSGKKLFDSGRVKWINLEERRDGVPTVEGWPTATQIKECLEGFGFERKLAYNRHNTHQDAIYVHRSELQR
jgi:FkbM family methyltransferase